MANERQLLPYRRYTRQRMSPLVTGQSISGLSGNINIELNRVGMLNYLFIVLRGTVNLSAPGALADLGPWSLIDNIRVDMNLGNMNLVDISGYQLYQLNKLMAFGYGPDGAGDYTPSATGYAAGVASGNNSWILPLFIPISANPGSQFDSGLINLQAPEVQVNLKVRLASAGANFVTQFNTLTAVTLDVYQCYFDIPNPEYVALPPGEIVRTVEVTKPVSATGVLDYTLERQGTLLQLLSTFRANGARSDGIDRVRLIANINDTIYDLEPSFSKQLYEMYYGKPCNTGVFALDLWHSRENPSSGDDRDTINTEVLTTLQWNPTVSAGTTLGSGNNFWITARRILVKFAVPGLGPSM